MNGRSLQRHLYLRMNLWLTKSESQRKKLQTMARTHQLSKYYCQHPLVKTEFLGTVWPCSIYVDGTLFNAHDSVLGFFCVNMVSGARHLCGTLRKSTICRCGCKCWCSIYPVLQFLQWSLLALQNDTFPDRRADHTRFDPVWQATRWVSKVSCVAQRVTGRNIARQWESPAGPLRKALARSVRAPTRTGSILMAWSWTTFVRPAQMRPNTRRRVCSANVGSP